MYNGLPVYTMCERVNRYTVVFLFMLTSSFFYGTMGTVRKGKFCELRISGSGEEGGWIGVRRPVSAGSRCRDQCSSGRG